MSTLIGVDGCSAGWLAVTDDAGGLSCKLFSTAATLLAAYRQAHLVLVDIPIGLPWGECPVRPCDSAARKLLGAPRASSVFPAPFRAAAHAPTVAAARECNVTEVGRSLSEQAWGICKKVSEVDDLLRDDSRVRAVLREVHPEVCFHAFNGGRPMAHSKKSRAGREERMAVLSRLEPRTAGLLAAFDGAVRRSDAKVDDLLDALVAYLTAVTRPTALATPPGVCTRDERGLPMEMVLPG